MRSKKGKKKAIEEDPIDSYDDMYTDDLDDSHFVGIPELNAPSPAVAQNLSGTSIARPISESSTLATTSRTAPTPLPQITPIVSVDSDDDKVTVLYKKMLRMRDKVYISKFEHYLFKLIRIRLIS